MTGSYKRFDQINPSLFDNLIRASRMDDQPEGTDFTPTGLMSPQTGVRQTSITPEQQTETTSDSILTRAASAIGAFSTNPDLVASSVVPQPRIPEEVDLSAWESMTPISEIVGPSQTEQAIPTLPSSTGIDLTMPQLPANQYVPIHDALPDITLPTEQPETVEEPEMVVLSPEEIERYTTRTIPKNGRYPTHRELGDTEGIIIHYTHSAGRQGGSLQAYYDNGIAQGVGAPIHIARDGTITIVGDWRNANIQHAAPSRGRGLHRTLSGAEYNTLNTIGIEMEVGWNYNSGVPGGSQWDGPDGISTPEQDAALARLAPWLLAQINAERPEDAQLTLDRDVLAHIEIGRKQEVEGREALGNLRESAGLPRERDVDYYVDDRGRENVIINRSLVPRPRPTGEGSSKQTTEKGEAGKQTTAREEAEPQTYTVQRGDNPSKIARNFPGVSGQNIMDANEIEDATSIQIGQVLTIPAPSAAATEEIASVTPTPSLSGVATDYKTTAVALANDLMRDLGLTDIEAAAIVGNLAHESGRFLTLQERRPSVEGSRGGYGYPQWTGPRRVAYEAWARENNMDVDSYESNYGYLIHELTNRDRAVQDLSMGITSLNRIRGGTNLGEMVSSFSGVSGKRLGYLMPAEETANFDERTSLAREVLGFLREQ